MITITTPHAGSNAAASAFFARGADNGHLARVEPGYTVGPPRRPFAARCTGVLETRGAPKVKFVVERLVPEREFVDVSLLVGGRPWFDHAVTSRPDAGCRIDVTVSMSGPLRWPWARILGKGFGASAPPDLDRLVNAAESPQ